jgi:hypothetical protein
LATGPDPARCGADGFCTYLESGPFLFGAPEEYANRKEAHDEGGPAILVVEVPDEIIALAENEWFPLSQGLVQVSPGAGLDELLTAWPHLRKEIRLIESL